MIGDWAALPLLFLAGAAAGVINVLAGGGSFLTLPLLIFVGLPPTVANATNRVGVLTQNVAAVWGFHRHAVLDWRWALGATAPALIGAVLGTWAALRVSDETFSRTLAVLMVLVTIWTLADRGGDPAARPLVPAGRWWVAASFFVIGVYGGFVQAGVGFFILAVTTAAGLDLVRGNAVKVLSVLLLAGLSLAIFAWSGQVRWGHGVALGLGNAAGALVGVRLAIAAGHRWLRIVVTATIVVFAVKLWFW
jgi:uncharacterized membrane protein YfcA